jgi:hypothetical protein
VSSPTSILSPGEPETFSESLLPLDIREEGSKAVLPQPEAPEPESPKPEAVPQEKKQPEWEIRNLEDAYEGAEAPPWIIKDLVMSGTLTLVGAEMSNRFVDALATGSNTETRNRHDHAWCELRDSYSLREISEKRRHIHSFESGQQGGSRNRLQPVAPCRPPRS